MVVFAGWSLFCIFDHSGKEKKNGCHCFLQILKDLVIEVKANLIC